MTMSLIRICPWGLAAQIGASGPAAAQSASAATQPPLIDRENEIARALSACPPSLASKATVYVLDEAGYVKVRDDENGFTAIVQHSLPTSQEPQCMDNEGTRTLLPRMLKVAELRAQGKTPEEVKRFVADAFAKCVFRPPSRPASITCSRRRTWYRSTRRKAPSGIVPVPAEASAGSGREHR